MHLQQECEESIVLFENTWTDNQADGIRNMIRQEQKIQRGDCYVWMVLILVPRGVMEMYRSAARSLAHLPRGSIHGLS